MFLSGRMLNRSPFASLPPLGDFDDDFDDDFFDDEEDTDEAEPAAEAAEAADAE